MMQYRSLALNFHGRNFRPYYPPPNLLSNGRCDVFLSHRGIDTKTTVAPLLYDNLRRLGFSPFLDNKTLKPGDKLFHKINNAIFECKVGVAVFSPHYCESFFCLHELALMLERQKKLIPIFCDVKPSQLRVVDTRKLSVGPEQLRRFKWALEEAKYTVGLTFDSSTGNFSDIVSCASDIIISTMMELDDENKLPMAV
ncbi:TMV resistance protein N-like [Neltuma alba]|uniref:TMV resistance protein N-like n=1 Tax=Neltuma alba TaxID=207710 RepID=UPI0010A2E12E|nr:TMV resistance protein N-like [Prosopis alba]